MIITDIAMTNKYTKWYIAIMENAKVRAKSRKEAKSLLGYVEGHHIVPTSIFDNKDIVFLTTREHFVAHRLLVRMLSGANKIKMEEAISMFLQGRNLNSRQVAICLSYKHKPCSDERRDNIKSARMSTPKKQCPHCGKFADGGNYTRHHGDNCKHNPSISDETLRIKKEKCQKGYLAQAKNGNLKPPKPAHGSYTCVHCGKHGTNYGVMMRWHFDKCKFK
jgi:5-methylcytosine-specific restriction endonuclease McrA